MNSLNNHGAAPNQYRPAVRETNIMDPNTLPIIASLINQREDNHPQEQRINCYTAILNQHTDDTTKHPRNKQHISYNGLSRLNLDDKHISI